jgi:DeoR family fructose operon transcriptional repressor
MTETRGIGAPKFQFGRQREIYMLALRHGSVDVSDLARRDHEPMVAARDMRNSAEKLRIAQEAILEVPDCGSVIIDSGSTGQRLAEVFPVDRDVHVVTNSLATAHTLARRGITNLTMLGGAVRTSTLAVLDAGAVATVRSMRVDVLFISCDGFSYHRGLTTPYEHEFLMKRAMLESARRVVAILDHTKFGNDQMYSYAAPHEIDVLITDTGVDDDTLAILAAHEVDIRRA